MQTPEDAASPGSGGDLLDGGSEELFDLFDDPFELVNLLEKPELTKFELEAYKSLRRSIERLLTN